MHRKLAFVVVVVFLWPAAIGSSPRPSQAPRRTPAAPATAALPDPVVLIRALNASAERWNQGDMNGFMAPYAKPATYMTSGGLIGVDAMRTRYLAKYFNGAKPDQQLRFDQLDVRPLGADHALMTGRFILAGGGKPEQTGRFTLVWMRTPAGWRILHDHSS
jgi:ketosteroid isomerase-like protein